MPHASDKYWNKFWKDMEKAGIKNTRSNLVKDIGNYQMTKDNMTEEQQHHEKQVLKMRAKFLSSRIAKWKRENKKKKGQK